MATNPKFPEQFPEDQRPRDEHPKMRLVRKSRVPWPLLIIVVAAIILAAFIYWLPQQPRRAAAPTAAVLPPQPTGDQIQFTNLKVTADPTKGSAYVDGRLINVGTTAINGVAVDATFKALNGQALETIRGKVEGVVGTTSKAGNATVSSGVETQDLTQAPIKPNEGRPIRIYFSHLPQGWNGQVPDLRIVQVTAVGAAK